MEKDSHFTVEKPGEHYLNPGAKADLTSDVTLIWVSPDRMWWKEYFTSVVFVTETYNPSLTMRKMWDIFQNACLVLFKPIKVYKDKESLRSYHKQEAEKARWLNAMSIPD